MSNEYRSGGFWLRTAAWLLDDFLCFLFAIVLFFLTVLIFSLSDVTSFLKANGLEIQVGYLFFILLYKSVFESSSLQATLGKRVVGLRIISSNNETVSPLQALSRNLLKILSYISLGFGFLIVALPGRKRALHDLLSRCSVVRSKG